MPLFGGQAHPKGPEGRPFAERTITIHGRTQDCVLTLSYPQPDDIADRVQNGYYVKDKWDSPFGLEYNYRGHFWQGDFGTLDFSLIIECRVQDSPPWKDMESLLKGIPLQHAAHNQKQKNYPPKDRQEWMEPSLSQLNGIPCVQQYVYRGFDPKGEWLYYFPIDEDHVLVLSFWFVPNRIPGQSAESDWRPRAEALANQILATVRVRWKPSMPEKEESRGAGAKMTRFR